MSNPVQGSYFNLTLEWLVKHAYPPGPIHLTRTHLPTLPLYYSVGNFKVIHIQTRCCECPDTKKGRNGLVDCKLSLSTLPFMKAVSIAKARLPMWHWLLPAASVCWNTCCHGALTLDVRAGGLHGDAESEGPGAVCCIW